MDIKDSRQRKKKQSQNKTRSRLTKYSSAFALRTPEGSYQPRPPAGTDTHLVPLGPGYTLIKTNEDEICTTLCLSSKKLTQVPREKLNRDIQTLLLDDNKITRFVIDQPLDSLKELILRQNCLSEFPYCEHSYDHAPNLVVLDLSHNNFSNGISPNSLLNFTSLERLDLSSSGLKFLPSEIGLLNHLTGLWIDNNHLQELPREIINLNKLKDFDARKNSLTSPWQYAVDKGGFEAVKSFFLSPADKSSPHVKLILLGPAGVGKSILRQNLLGGDQSFVSSLRHQHFEYPDLRFELSVFDFANFSNHEIFFSAYSFYLILWDMTKYNNPKYINDNVQYWVDLVQAKAPGSTIIIIGTNSDELIPLQLPSNNSTPSSKSYTGNRNQRVHVTEISEHYKYKEAEAALFSQLYQNESLRLNDIRRRMEKSIKTAVKNKLSRLLYSRPKIHPNIIPLHLSTSDMFVNGPQVLERRVSHSTSMKEINQSFQLQHDESRKSSSDQRNGINGYLSRTYSESDIRTLSSPGSRSGIKIPTPSRPVSNIKYSTPGQTCNYNVDNDDGTGITQLVGLIAELVHDAQESLTISPPCIECTKFRKYLDEFRTRIANEDHPPYCKLKDFENFLSHKENAKVEDGVVLMVVEFWATLGLIIKFDFNQESVSDSSNIYLVLDPIWLRECLSGLQALREENIAHSTSFKSFASDSPAMSHRRDRDRGNGFRMWSVVEQSLIKQSQILKSMVERSHRYCSETFLLLRRILETLSIIIPSGYKSLSIPNTSVLQGLSRTATPASRLSSNDSSRESLQSPISYSNEPDPMYLIPSLMLEGEKTITSQKYSKAGCIQLEKRVYLSKYFVPPEIIPRILARVYSYASHGEWDTSDTENDIDKFGNDPTDPMATANSRDNSTQANGQGEYDMGLFYCWKTAFSQEIDHVTISVSLSNSISSSDQPDNLYEDTNSGVHLPREGQYISIGTTCHVLLVHVAVKLITRYWEAVQDELSTYPGLEYDNFTLCPVCLMKQRPPNQCGVFDDDDESNFSDYSEDYDEDNVDTTLAAEENILSKWDCLLDQHQDNSKLYSAVDPGWENFADKDISVLDNLVSPAKCDAYEEPKVIKQCPRGCGVIIDFYKYIPATQLKKLYPTESRLQEVLIDYISSQISKSKVSPSLSLEAVAPVSDNSKLSYGLGVDRSIAASIVDIRAYIFNSSSIVHETDCDTIIGELEETRYNGYLFEARGRKFVVSSVMAQNLIEPRQSRPAGDLSMESSLSANFSLGYIYIVDLCQSSNELYAADVHVKKSSKITKFDSLNTPRQSSVNPNVEASHGNLIGDRQPPQHLFFVLEVIAKINSFESKSMQTLIKIPRDRADVTEAMNSISYEDYMNILSSEFAKFSEGTVGMTVYILSFNSKQRHLNKTYGRIVRILPEHSRGELRSICLVSTKNASNRCVPGALVVDCVSNRLIGTVLNAESRLNETYFVGTPK